MTSKKNISPLFALLMTVFASCILLSNILAAKQLAVWIWNIPAGTIIFPISYIVSDMVSEVYGYKASRRVSWIGFIINLVAVLAIALAIALPSPVWFEGADAFAQTLGSTWRLLLAGFVAYHLGSWVNDIIISKMKLRNRARGGESMQGFGLRALLSSLFGFVIDSIIFAVIGFAGQMDWSAIVTMIIAQSILKIAYEILIMPLLTWLVRKAKDYEGGEVFDDEIRYTLW